MKIVHVTPKFTPGLGYQENYLPKKQHEIGHEVELVTSNVRSEVVYNDIKLDGPGVYEYDGIRTHRLPSRLTISDGGLVVMKGLERTLESLSPDVVHAHTLFNLSTPRSVRFGSTRGVPVFVDVHVDNDNLHLDRLYKRIGMWGANHVIQSYVEPRAKRFFAVNPHAERLLEHEFDVPPGKISFLPLGVDTSTFSPDDDHRKSTRSRLGIESHEMLLVTVGNLDQTKDVDVLLQAFAPIATERDDLSLLIVGDGPSSYLSHLHGLVDQLDLTSVVEFTGGVPHQELPSIYNAADIGVWPGKLGISAIEALGTGLPIIVPDTAATGFLTSRQNGLLFERGTVSQLQECLQTYIRDESLRSEHATNAEALVTETLAWEQIARQAVELYQEG